MKKPHVHAELIKAWADGAEIQVFDEIGQSWWDMPNPDWHDNRQYRIKPTPKPDLRLFYFVSDHVVQCSSAIHIHNLALTFDGETGALKSAEVL